MGWVSARVQALEARQLQSYKRLEFGQIRARCPNTTDRSAACFRCGDQGQQMAASNVPAPRCHVCADHALDAKHRIWGKACSPPKKKRMDSQKNNG